MIDAYGMDGKPAKATFAEMGRDGSMTIRCVCPYSNGDGSHWANMAFTCDGSEKMRPQSLRTMGEYTSIRVRSDDGAPSMSGVGTAWGEWTKPSHDTDMRPDFEPYGKIHAFISTIEREGGAE